MNEIPVSYQAHEGSEGEVGFQAIFDAIGAYEATLPFPDHHHHSATISQTPDGTVKVGLTKTVRDAEDAQQRAESIKIIRQGIEDQFDEVDRERLVAQRVEDERTKL